MGYVYYELKLHDHEQVPSPLPGVQGMVNLPLCGTKGYAPLAHERPVTCRRCQQIRKLREAKG